MWLNVPEHLREIKTPEMDDPVDCGSGEKIQVTKEVGEQLVKLDGISETNTE